MNIVTKTLVAGAFLAVSGAASAATLYSQPWDGHSNLLASQNDTQPGGFGNFATSFDDFKLAGGATVKNVSFTGGYFNGAPAGINAFTVNFYSDLAGAPGSLLQSTTISGDGSEALFGCDSFQCSNYSLDVNFAAAGGTTYWMSIVPDMIFPPQWGWAGGTGGDGASYQMFFGTGAAIEGDRAFTLNGAAGVPEPASWALMIMGFGGVGAAMRSRRRTMAATA